MYGKKYAKISFYFNIENLWNNVNEQSIWLTRYIKEVSFAKSGACVFLIPKIGNVVKEFTGNKKLLS